MLYHSEIWSRSNAAIVRWALTYLQNERARCLHDELPGLEGSSFLHDVVDGHEESVS